MTPTGRQSISSVTETGMFLRMPSPLKSGGPPHKLVLLSAQLLLPIISCNELSITQSTIYNAALLFVEILHLNIYNLFPYILVTLRTLAK